MIIASATAFALAATVAATSWASAAEGPSQAIGHQHASSQSHWPAGTGAFAQSLTLGSVERAAASRELRAMEIARAMMRRFGWRPRFQFRYLRWLWDRESSWNVYATNPYSGAYGIPQALPGYKMASAGRDWRTSPWVQIRWGLRYIRARYGSPRVAWDHEIAYGWYLPVV